MNFFFFPWFSKMKERFKSHIVEEVHNGSCSKKCFQLKSMKKTAMGGAAPFNLPNLYYSCPVLQWGRGTWVLCSLDVVGRMDGHGPMPPPLLGR